MGKIWVGSSLPPTQGMLDSCSANTNLGRVSFIFCAWWRPRGVGPAKGADEQEEERDAREPGSPLPRRRGRSPGWA